jgi:hypothetical protein
MFLYNRPYILCLAGPPQQKGYKGPPPYEPSPRDGLDRLERWDEKAGLHRSIALKYVETIFLIAGLPSLIVYILMNPETQTPQGLGGLGVIVTLVTIVIGAIEKLGPARRKKDASNET